MKSGTGISGGVRRIAMVVALGVLPAAAASAQESADAGGALLDTVPPGMTVWITESAEPETRARVVGITGDVLTARVGDTVRRIPLPDIVRVRARRADPVIDGALIGAGAAVASGLFLCSLTEPLANCRDDIGPMLRIGALGAGVGTCVDALIRGRKTIYQAGARTVSLRAAPLVGRRAVGFHMSMGF